MLITRRNQNWLPEVFNNFFDNDFLPKTSATAPSINVIEKANEYEVELAAPGMTKDDFKVSLDEDENLVISMEKQQKAEENNEEMHYLRREFSYNKFQQTLLLPEDVDLEKIAATVENGILDVKLPKKSAQELKKEAKLIEIQ